LWVAIPPGPIKAETVVEITGEKNEHTFCVCKRAFRGWCTLRSQDFQMEPKNEEIYFWRK
jgi:hypothetical protein